MKPTTLALTPQFEDALFTPTFFNNAAEQFVFALAETWKALVISEDSDFNIQMEQSPGQIIARPVGDGKVKIQSVQVHLFIRCDSYTNAIVTIASLHSLVPACTSIALAYTIGANSGTWWRALPGAVGGVNSSLAKRPEVVWDDVTKGWFRASLTLNPTFANWTTTQAEIESSYNAASKYPVIL